MEEKVMRIDYESVLDNATKEDVITLNELMMDVIATLLEDLGGEYVIKSDAVNANGIIMTTDEENNLHIRLDKED